MPNEPLSGIRNGTGRVPAAPQRFIDGHGVAVDLAAAPPVERPLGPEVARATLGLLQKELAKLWAAALMSHDLEASERLALASQALQRARRLLDGTAGH